MSAYLKYQKNKNSNIQWIGDMPDHWDVLPIRAILQERKEKNRDGCADNILSVMKDVGVIRYDEKGNVGNKSSDRPENYKVVHKHDIVLNSMNLVIGSVGIANENGVTSSVYIIYFLKNDCNVINYYYNIFRDRSFQKHLGTFGRGIMELRESIKVQDIKTQLVPVPPKHEQLAIANFLSEKIGKINLILEKKYKILDSLTDKANAIISEAVIGGNVLTQKRKYSGSEWIGDVPSDWDVIPLMNLFYENKVKNHDGSEQNLLSLSYGRVIRKDINNNFGLLPESFNTYQVVNDGILVLRLTDLQNDKKSLRVGLAKERGIITSAYIGLVAKRKMSNVYLYYLMHSYDIKKVFYNMGGGVRQSMNFNDLKWLPVVIPPREEQEKIVSYIEEKVNKISKVKEMIKQQISIIEEYRSAIIHEAVTGKIKI